jgi:hypothetical protein
VADIAQERGAIRPRAFPVARFSRELIALTVLFVVYKWGRTIHVVDVTTAYENADAIWQFERYLGLPSELAAQQAMLTAEWLTEFANVYYLAAHFPATIACLVWLYLRRPGFYPPVRRALIGMTSIALIAHLAFPLAPPRLLPNLGFVDTGKLCGPNVYPKAPAEDTMVNQYAAMPSLHVGWAVLVAAALVAASSGPWRWLWVAHPAITTIAVVSSAHHYWLDGLVAVGLLGITLAVCAAHARRRAARSGSAVDRSGSTASSLDSALSQRR